MNTNKTHSEAIFLSLLSPSVRLLLQHVFLLQCAEKLGQVDRVGQMVEECGGVDKLEELQNHENMDIYKKALEIVERFFSADEDPLPEDEVTSTDAFQFNDNNSMPDGGFSF